MSFGLDVVAGVFQVLVKDIVWNPLASWLRVVLRNDARRPAAGGVTEEHIVRALEATCLQQRQVGRHSENRRTVTQGGGANHQVELID